MFKQNKHGRGKRLTHHREMYQKGGTLYDYLMSSGRNGSAKYGAGRKELAKQAGIKNYTGTASQNEQLKGFLIALDGSPQSAYAAPETSAYGNQSIDELRPMGQAPSQYSPTYESDMQIFQGGNQPQVFDQRSAYDPLSGILQTDLMPFLKRKQQGGRLVSTVPEGFKPLRTQGNRQYYNKTEEEQLAMASGSGSAQAGSSYDQFLRSKLQSGVSPQQLVDKRYISSGAANQYQQYYTPREEVVYTEPQQQQAPAQTPGFDGEGIFTPGAGGRLVGKFKYPAKDANGGYTEPVQFRYVDQMGQIDNSRGMYNVPADVWSNQIARGNRHLYDEKALQQYLVQQRSGGFISLSQLRKMRAKKHFK